MQVFIQKAAFKTDSEYRAEIKKYRDKGFIIHRVAGGVMCFEFIADYETWKRQK